MCTLYNCITVSTIYQPSHSQLSHFQVITYLLSPYPHVTTTGSGGIGCNCNAGVSRKLLEGAVADNLTPHTTQYGWSWRPSGRVMGGARYLRDNGSEGGRRQTTENRTTVGSANATQNSCSITSRSGMQYEMMIKANRMNTLSQLPEPVTCGVLL